ncbi:hypothetical protein [Senegalia massiliensis]|uniref:Uncharacterized protein n=1 Tax=Senegalia massiliensis TaxID=1720316 RepID=A0A845R4J0_9CLOT|nr:hypothetical protein [Senegalia massiliensis]NBI08332.1 hypothetical protein [Senegalia massiliensis]
MPIIIKRNTGWLGVASKIQIKLNGQRIGSVMEKKHIEVEIPKGKANLEVTRFGSNSNKIAVKDGDVIEITSTIFYRTIIPLIIPISFLISLIPNLTYKLIIFAIFFALIVISQFFFKIFNLKVVTNKTSQHP